MTKATSLDVLLHTISLQIANCYRIVKEGNEDPIHPEHENEEEMLKDFIEAYTCIRRHINKGEDGKRFGASYANKVMQKGDID